MQGRGMEPLDIRRARVTDGFWMRAMELVRTQVIPYQWAALNDRVEGAEKSWWMHNMRAAARAIQRRKAGQWQPRTGEAAFVSQPAGAPDPDRFYGWVFQDSDGYKWLEAVSYSLMTHPDPALQATAQEAVDAIRAAQEDDGYLDTYYTLNGIDRRFTNLKDHHELYCFGHLTEAAVAWRQATGRDDLLETAVRFADCIAAHIGPGEGQKRGYPGHEIAEMALVRLWQETGEERFLRQAAYYVNERGREPNYFAEEIRRSREAGVEQSDWGAAGRYAYYQAHKPVRDQDEVLGHAVRAMYLYSGAADVARLTGDEALRAACDRVWHSTVSEKMYITGGVGATHVGEAFSLPFDLPNDAAYSETCAAIGLVFFARRMLQLKPDSRYADVMELALYNTVLAGMALDGQSFFYVNPLEVNPAACHADERLQHVKPVRQKWFGCACCPPNIARTVASLSAYAWSQTPDVLYTHLYVAGEVDAALNGQPLRLKFDAGLPWQGEVTVTVTGGEAEGVLAFRKPGWAREAEITIPAGFQLEEKDGYWHVSGPWKPGDTVRIALPLPVRAVAAHPAVREDAGLAAFMRGPVVYCAEEKDNGPALHLLRVKPAEAAAAAETEETEIGGLPVTALVLPAARESAGENASLYRDWQPPVTVPVRLKLIPYFAWANRGEGEMRVWLRTE
ncbi:MAG: glycoside hydrolase family 127 protein [Clostridia bacterium]|nr:glycoside hydrolase family 127 protein [Clostridia bacterium]